MIETLKDLTDRERMAIMSFAVQVITSGTDGRFRTDDSDFVTVSDSLLENPLFEMMPILQGSINMSEDYVREILSDLSEAEKRAVQSMISGICHDNALRMITAGMMMKTAGFKSVMRDAPRQMEDRDYGIEEEDRVTPIKDAYVRLIDTGKILIDKVEKFRFFVGGDPEPIIIESGYDDWLQKQWCPSNGMVGIKCKSCRQNNENICFVNFSNKIVVPVFEDGLECIRDYEWRTKSNNNFILAHDKDGKRCRDLRGKLNNCRTNNIQENSKNMRRIIFIAHKQDRFQRGQNFPTSYVERVITLDYDLLGMEVDINVVGIMQPKHARFYEDTGTILKYRDTTNPDFRYEVETDPRTNETVRFSIFAGNMVEYRYTN